MNKKIIDNDIEAIIGSLESWSFLMNKTVLITGASGFIPAYMVETIAKLNAKFKWSTKIIALVRNEHKAKNRFSNLLGFDWFQLLVQDVCEPIKLEHDVHFIIHAASQASPKYYGVDPVGTLSANTIGTYNVLEFARENKKNIEGVLFFSSAEIYGDVSACSNTVSEQYIGPLDCLALRSCYAESKRVGETMCISWAAQYDLPVKIIRVFHTYGPGMDLSDGRVFADFVNDIVHNKDIEIKSDGLAIRAFSYLADTVAACFHVLALGKLGEAYNVGNDEGESNMYDLACLLVRISGSSNLNVHRRVAVKTSYLASTVNRIVPNTQKIRALGWSPNFNLEEGFLRTINYYRV